MLQSLCWEYLDPSQPYLVNPLNQLLLQYHHHHHHPNLCHSRLYHSNPPPLLTTVVKLPGPECNLDHRNLLLADCSLTWNT